MSYITDKKERIELLIELHSKKSKSQVLEALGLDSNAEMSGLSMVGVIIGIVIAFRVFVSIMPETISDASAVTAAGGAGENWSTSEQSMWGLIPLMLIVFGVVIAMVAMKRGG